MKKITVLLIVLLALNIVNAQNTNKGATKAAIEQYYESPISRLKKIDSAYLFQLPQLTLPTSYLNGSKNIPSIVDHSGSQYLQPIFYQVALECGQAAGIAYTFTYEMNRLRNLPSNVAGNQYPTHFAWNFKNGGTSTGVNCLETWDVIRMAGTPNTTQWGGANSSGGASKWMTGYSKYYEAMKNRIYEVYSIPVNTPQGLATLKQWLYDHLDGSAEGGIANFYSTYVSNGSTFPTLPAGTPEAGMKVITQFSSYVNHCQTIVGFNDSIRFDYNGDGQYTNNIDINSDGVVDMRDWEIGGVKFTNSFGIDFANNGFCYMMYKVLAETPANGGIWNTTTFVIKVKENYQPLATYKVNLTHSGRTHLKLVAGIATNTTATIPEKTMEFSVFNNQGGELFMQGDTSQAAKTIDLGLDISPLLNEVTPGLPVKYFLQVVETDASNLFTGQINSFSLMDYTSGSVVETACTQTNTLITNNSTTTLSLNNTLNFTKPTITNNSLPNAEAFEIYNQQLTATGGTAPYHWRFKMGYDESEQVTPFPQVMQQQLSMSNTYQGFATKSLPFDFPFYGKKYNQIVINTSGYIEFRSNIYQWPFLVSEDLLFKSREIIAPFKANLIMNANDGVWVESSQNYCIVRWKMSVQGQSTSQVNFSVKLFPSGDIEFYYGTINISAGTVWKAGVSRGNAKDFVIPSISNSFTTNPTERKIVFDNYEAPKELFLSDEGQLTGTPSEYYNNVPIHFQVIDNNELVNEKTLTFSTTFSNRIVVLSHVEHAGNDNIVNNGELVNVDLVVKNIDTTAVTNALITATSTDPYITFTDNQEYFGYIGAGNTYTLSNAIKFQVSNSIPNEHPINITLHTTCDGSPSTTNIVIIAYSSDVTLTSASVFDGNDNSLNTNETDTIVVVISNSGMSAVEHIQGLLTTPESNITFIQSLDSVTSLPPFSTSSLRYIIQTSPSFVEGRMNDFHIALTAENLSKTLSFSLFAGGNTENFETGTFTHFPWVLSDTAWTIRTDSAFEGNKVARSGMITHNQTSTLTLTEDLLVPGMVSFYKKVSCEDDANNNWDYLSFAIDGQEKGRWDGEVGWDLNAYPVTAGAHTFCWTYRKDVSVNSGYDAAWVDLIKFPAFGSSNPTCTAAPDSIIKVMYSNATEQTSIHLMNTGTGTATYQILIKDLDGYNVPWLQAQYLSGSLNTSESDGISLTFNTNNMLAGVYPAVINITFSNCTILEMPVKLTVLMDVGISENTNQMSVSAYPNPAKDLVSIVISGALDANTQISIYNTSGQLVEVLNHAQKVNNQQVYHWLPKSLPAGLYFYKITSGKDSFNGKINLIP